MVQKIQYTDNLKEGTDKLNQSIDQSNAAILQSKNADQKSTQALNNSVSTQTQLDNIVVEGDSSVEAAQARVDSSGTSHPTLKSRLDNFEVSATQQLQQISYSLQGLPSGETEDATPFIQNILNLARDNKVKKITFPKNTYRVNTPIFIQGSDIEVDFSGSTLLSYANATGNKRAEIGIINAHGEMLDSNVDIVTYLRSIYPNQHTPPANAPVLTSIEKVDNSTSRVLTSNNSYFVVGDEVLLKGWTRPTVFPYSASVYEPELHTLAKVVSIDANYVYIDYASPLRFPNFVDNAVFKSRMMKVQTVKNVSIKNVTIKDMMQVTTRGTMTSSELLQAMCGISPMLVDNFSLENVTVENHRQPAVYPYCTRNLHFKNVHGEKPQSWEIGGYVLCFMTSRDIVLEHITGDSCRHIIDFSTGSNNARVYDSYGQNTFSSTFTSHGQGEHDIYYFNCKGTLGFGSGLAGFPNINSNYTFENCELDLVTVVDDTKWVNNVSFDKCNIKMKSNPTFLNLSIENSSVLFINENHQPLVNTRGLNLTTSLRIEDSLFEYLAAESSKISIYFNGYEEISFKGLTIKPADSSLYKDLMNIIFHNARKVILDDVKSDVVRYRYSNDKFSQVNITTKDSDLKNKTDYLWAMWNLTNTEVSFNIHDSKLEQNGTNPATDDIWFVLRGNLGTLTNSTVRGYMHHNYLIGRIGAKVHGRVTATDNVYAKDNIIVNMAPGSIWDNTENQII